MRFRFSIFILLLTLMLKTALGQIVTVKIEDFVTQHNGFEENEEGEINPINLKEINKRIRFFIEEKYPKIVDFTRNIIWDSYGTFLSPSDRYHSHTFIVQVKVTDVDRLKYLEVQYDPYEKKVTGNFQWIPEDEEFYLVDEQVEEQKLLPNLKELEISNHDKKPSLNDFLKEHQGFIDERDRLNLSENEIVPINVAKINKLIRSFNDTNYSNVEYTRNIIWDSYTTFLSPFDKYNFHVFIAQVKVEGINRLKYLEVFYNPATEKITTDFEWIESDEEFFRVVKVQESDS
ncbi:MAG: hypothetical protein VXY15_04495 [Bacteroidota bacterium]|nr:hypothetical protein [Bacteroidota bacterium]